MIFNSFDTSFFKVTQLLKDIDLTEQKDTLSMNLSGGQKRKLCVGVALVGNPKVLMICARHKSKSAECSHGHISYTAKKFIFIDLEQNTYCFFLIQHNFRKFQGFCVLFINN